jgi:hypothetical protein
MPEVNDPKEYGDRWNAWWWSMQPSWRDPESPFDLPSEASPASWSHLICGGPNGLLLVILALAWWMKSSTGSSGTNPSPIQEAAIDVTWVLAQLKSALEVGIKGKKRELDIGPDDNLPSTKRYLILSQKEIEEKANEI